MSNRFHNKFHRNNHHTDATGGYPDSSYDPIASPAAPFQGTFFSEGDIVTTKNLSANESVFADNGTIHENFLVKNDLSVLNDVSVGNNISVDNNASIASLNVTGNATIQNNLTVVGNLSALGSVTQIDTIVSVTSALSVRNSGTGPAATITQTGAQDVAVFYDDSNPVLTIKDGGNIGINTNSPNEKLTISGNVSSSADAYSNRILLKDGSQTSPSITFQDNTNTGIYSSEQNTVNISTNSAERLRVYSNGNVALDDFNNLPGAAASPAYKVMHFASPLFNGATMISMASRSNQTCFFGNLSGNSFVIGNEGSASSFEFKNNISYASSDTLNTGNSLLTIKGTGNVGIGTTNPNEKLTVNGNISAVGNHIFESSNSSPTLRITQKNGGVGYAILVEDQNNPDTTPLVVTSDGSLGIGTLNPFSKVNIIADNENAFRISNNEDHEYYASFGCTLSAGYFTAGSAIERDVPLVFRTSLAGAETEKVRFTADGKVGIGTSTPNEKLTVNGNISATGTLYVPAIIAESFYTPTNSLLSSRIHETAANKTITLPSSANDIELTTTQTVTITGFDGGIRGILYTLTNVGAHTVTISATSLNNIYIRNGTSWKSNTCSLTSSYLRIPANHSCNLRKGTLNQISIW